MAATMQFDLVSPERRLASLAATEVQIPGKDGDMAAMPGHAPVITTLRPGVVRAVGVGGVTSYVVTGGFAEITATGISVLAEQAVPLQEMTKTILPTQRLRSVGAFCFDGHRFTIFSCRLRVLGFGKDETHHTRQGRHPARFTRAVFRLREWRGYVDRAG